MNLTDTDYMGSAAAGKALILIAVDYIIWCYVSAEVFGIILQELSDMTAIKADDILSTLQSLDLIQYRKGQHAICADPKVLDRHLKAAGRGGLEVDVSKLIWTPYKEQG